MNLSYPDSVILELSKAGALAPAGSPWSGVLRQVWMSSFPDSEVMMGCSLAVAKVYTCPVSEATSTITWVPVRVASSYAFFMMPVFRLEKVV